MSASLRHIPAALLFLVFAAAARAADPLAELASFSAFKEVNLDKLAGGAVMAARGATMSFPRGLAVETAYVIRKPLARAAEFHLQWNPGRHPELKVYLHQDIPAHPTAADFQRISAAPSNSAVKSLAAATQRLSSGPSDLQMSAAEAKTFAGGGGGGGALPPPVASFWSKLLLQRAQAFLTGGVTRLPPYESGRESVRPGDEISRLLKDAVKLRGQFSALLEATPLTGAKGSLPPSPYWELFDVEGRATFSLGALYYKPRGDAWQAVDTQYYSSGGFYVLVTLYQMWPVKVGGLDCTLVWRGDLISSPSLAALHGVERMGSSSAMMRETQKVIEAFLKDAGK